MATHLKLVVSSSEARTEREQALDEYYETYVRPYVRIIQQARNEGMTWDAMAARQNLIAAQTFKRLAEGITRRPSHFTIMAIERAFGLVTPESTFDPIRERMVKTAEQLSAEERAQLIADLQAIDTE